MAGKRFYTNEGCPMAHALDLVGERWALLVVREVMFGPRRFTDLRNSLTGISPNVLSQRLEELDGAGIIARRQLPAPAAAWVYEITEWGSELEAVMRDLSRWAAQSPALPQGREMTPNALVLFFRSDFDPERARWHRFTLELRLDGQVFAATVARRELEIVPGPASRPDAVVTGSATALAAVARDGVPLRDAVRDGRLEIEGDRRAVEDFAGLFAA